MKGTDLDKKTYKKDIGESDLHIQYYENYLEKGEGQDPEEVEKMRAKYEELLA